MKSVMLTDNANILALCWLFSNIALLCCSSLSHLLLISAISVISVPVLADIHIYLYLSRLVPVSCSTVCLSSLSMLKFLFQLKQKHLILSYWRTWTQNWPVKLGDSFVLVPSDKIVSIGEPCHYHWCWWNASSLNSDPNFHFLTESSDVNHRCIIRN